MSFLDSVCPQPPHTATPCVRVQYLQGLVHALPLNVVDAALPDNALLCTTHTFLDQDWLLAY